MSDYVLVTDSNADLPDDYIEANNLVILSLSYTIDGETYDCSRSLPSKEFYSRMRSGSMPMSAQINPMAAKETLGKVLAEGKDVLFMVFSSALSGSYNAAMIAGTELKEEYPDRKIYIIDSLCASLGQGLLVHKAVEQKQKGMSIDELKAFVEKTIPHICHFFTVDDLNHLYRGGRLSKSAAILGTMVNLKPILHVNDEGKLINIDKVRGRKKSLITLVDNMEKTIGTYREKNDIVFISHGDCIEDAEFVKKLVEERFGINTFLINYVGPAIGTHSGPGTVTLFFLGDHR